MPYIPESERENFDDLISTLSDSITTSGQLNYVLTRLVHEFMNKVAGHNYDAMNDVVGTLECCKLEYYRRLAAPYEDIKKEVNGDVHPLKPL